MKYNYQVMPILRIASPVDAESDSIAHFFSNIIKNLAYEKQVLIQKAMMRYTHIIELIWTIKFFPKTRRRSI